MQSAVLAFIRRDAGEIGGAGDTHNSKKIDKVATSEHDDVKLTISNLTDRSAMLDDVARRMSLMKRDMATLMRAIDIAHRNAARSSEQGCLRGYSFLRLSVRHFVEGTQFIFV